MAAKSVLSLSRNCVGRDFIVGDLGGAFDQVFQAMQDARFDPMQDRLFSVGHLLGSEGSLTACIRFLRAPSVFAVLTNSEQDLIDLFADGAPDDESVEALAGMDFHGLAWLASCGYQQRMQLVTAMRMLPLAISVGNGGPAVGYVHGGVPRSMSWGEFLHGLRRDEDRCVRSALRGTAGEAEVDGVEHVFTCYTPEWDLTHCHANAMAVAPGPYLHLVEDMMAPLKSVLGREVTHDDHR
jgi:serine/threonine protein phosphatase 1